MVKKIGKLFATERTMKKFFPKCCFVDNITSKLELNEDYPIFIRTLNSVTYQIYGRSRKDYKQIISSIKTEYK